MSTSTRSAIEEELRLLDLAVQSTLCEERRLRGELIRQSRLRQELTSARVDLLLTLSKLRRLDAGTQP